jgi:hypothetical protein
LRNYFKRIKLQEFKEFITEASSSSLRDPKGKLFELLVAKHMHSMGKFPDSFRENNKPPEQVHDDLKPKIHPDEYDKINHGASVTAQHILKTLHKTNQPGIENKNNKYHIGNNSTVSWVSNPTDYKKLMDKHNTTDRSTKSNADIVLTHHSKDNVTHHAISLKYSSRIPTESGPGLKNLETHMATKDTPLQDISNKSNEKINKIIKEPNRKLAIGSFKGLPRDSESSMKIQEISLKGLTDIAKKYHLGLKKPSDGETPDQHQKRLSGIVNSLSGVGVTHDHTHYRVRYNPDRDTVKMSNHNKTHKKIMREVNTIIPVHSGTSVHFHGITHRGNQIHLGTLNVKRRDSPLSNIQGNYKLGNIYH